MDRKELIKRILADWQEAISGKSLFERDVSIPPLAQKYITTVIGPRRSGKSSLLQLGARNWTKKHPKTPALYINFEDERLDHTTEELELILECYREMYPHAVPESTAFFFDEIQIVPKWEKFVRRCHEIEKATVTVSGSNSKALSTDIATSLRGRTLNIKVLPLSFQEIWNLKTSSAPYPTTSRQRALALNIMREYFLFGGFPDVVLEENPRLKTQILQEYFQVMIFKDLVERFNIQQISSLKFFLKRLLASTARPFSVNKIYNEIKSSGLHFSKDKAYEFLDHAINCFFVAPIEQYSKKVIHKVLGEKKIFPIDIGYVAAVLGNHDATKSLEWAVFLDSVRRGVQVNFYKGKNECDFILSDGDSKLKAIQVAYSLKDKDTEKREYRGLLEACSDLKIKGGTIITAEENGSNKIEDIKIENIEFLKLTFS